MRNSTESGIAMITVLLVLMLMSALLVGFTTVVMSDQRYRFIDRDRGQAFYAASGAVEKLTADLGNLFLTNVAPTAAQVTALTTSAKQPIISGVTYTAVNAPQALPASLVTTYYCAGNFTQNGVLIPPKHPATVGTSGYTLTYCALNSNNNPTSSDLALPIKTGPYQGLVALQTPYQIDVTAKTTTGGEVHLSRTIEAVAIPIFQFGMFSDTDLSYFAEQNFGFGGRVHTNSNLFLAEFAGATLTMTGKVTAVGNIVRQYLSNGISISSIGATGPVSMATQGGAPTGNQNLAATQGSVVGMPGSAATAGWNTLSMGAAPPNYNGYMRAGVTGAKALKLPLTATGVGGTNIDVIRRPAIGEDPTSILYGERLFSKASLRILLSDTAADISNLPGITASAPVLLDGNWSTTPPAGYGPVSGATGRPPVALSPGPQATTLGANVSAGANAVQVASVAPFGVALLNVGSLPTVQNGVTCTGRTFNTFTGCTAAIATIAAGMPVTATINGGTVSTTLAAPWAALSPTITVPNGATGPFANGTFWLTPNAGPVGTAAHPMLVTCAGLQVATPQLQNCAGVTAAANTGNAINTSALSSANTGTIGGYIKIEKADGNGVWTDVTLEILNYGIGAPNLGPVSQVCADPSPNAILRMQRLRDNAGGTPTTNGGGCNYGTDVLGFRNPMNWWPQALFDTREAVQRDKDPLNSATGLPLVGVMYYIALDAKNLAKWFKAQAPFDTGTGGTARIDNTGYTVYFSDRRNNRNTTSQETAEFGWEDFVNPGVATGAPNGICDVGEDVNSNSTCETYGKTPNYNGTYNAVPPGAAAPLDITASPTTLVYRGQAQVNRPIIFRRALKLINGATLGSDPTVANRIGGLSVVSENPVYIQGDWNAASTFLVTDLHAATSIIADAVSILSNGWNDNLSFAGPYGYAAGGRLRANQSYFRVAILAGKGPAFPQPSDVSGASVFGTDGGAHNFLRMLEQDNGTVSTVNYRGSMATLSYSRQAFGTFKCCSGTASNGIVYSVPTRNFIFDTDFLVPALLPPNTPVFRDMNAVGFSQEIRPGR
jgi:hypothetical protein